MQILHRGIFMPAFDRILQLARMEEVDCEFVEVTAHEGARPTHAVWQGRVYHRGGAVVHPRSASAIGLVLRYCRPVRLLSSSRSTKTKTNPKQCFTKKIEFGFAQYGGADGSRTRVRKESG